MASPPQRKRKFSESPLANMEEHQPFQDEAGFYKVKLIKLARAHAVLLTVIGSREGNMDNIDVNHGDEEEALISHSQLSENEEGFNLHNATPSVATFSQCSQSSNVSKLDRWGSIASQRSAFSDFIVETGNVLESLPELGVWLENTVVKDNDDRSADTDHSKKSGTLQADASHSPTGLLHDSNSAVPAVAHVRVGIGVLVKDPKYKHKVFAGLRKGSTGAGTLALPGGHLELQECWEDCAAREVHEETGLQIRNIEFAHVTNDPMPEEGKHYVTVFMMAECVDIAARPKNLEPEKCLGWNSYSWQDLTKNLEGTPEDMMLFGPLRHLLEDQPARVLRFMNAF